MNHDESKIQAEIVQQLQAGGFVFFSVPNEASLSARRMMFFKTLGLKRGVADLVVVLPFKILFMEVKTPTGTQSQPQKDFQQQVQNLGHTYVIVRSVAEAMDAVVD
ncbi:MAG: VRR-NUC domain-containing protein [Advenella sp.]